VKCSVTCLLRFRGRAHSYSMFANNSGNRSLHNPTLEQRYVNFANACKANFGTYPVVSTLLLVLSYVENAWALHYPGLAAWAKNNCIFRGYVSRPS